MKLPEENIKTTLGSVSSLITSGSRGWAKYYSNEGALFLRMTNLPRDGIRLLFGNNKYVKLPYDSKEGQRTRVKQDDILISITAELGKIGFVESFIEEAYINQHLCLVRINSSKIDSMYTAYYLASTPQRNLWQRLNDSGAKSGLNLSSISNFPLEFPPLSEQKAIADLLSTWDEAIEKTQALIAAKEKQFKWLLKTLISDQVGKRGWRKVKLGEVADIVKGKQLNVIHMVESGKYYALNGGIEPSGYTNDWNTPENSITISEGGNSCGFVRFNREKFWSGGHCYSLRNVNNKVFVEFLYHFLKSKQQLIMNLRVGSGLPNIQKKDIDHSIVFLPELNEQKQIAETLNTAQSEINLLKQFAEKYKEQKRGLIQKLLTGRWRIIINK